jgi:hypothetical protein
MIQIKRFIERVSLIEGRQGRDVVIPVSDARGLRDELSKLLADHYEMKKDSPDEVIQVQVTGGTFK